ncbi:hypothetical protein F6Y05_39225 [Bacillus megaterium]|nr:hypothetical protein [Priestia megaterium]
MYLFIVFILLSIAAYFDWKTLKIPNWVHWVGIGVAIILCIFRMNVVPIEKMALNAFLVFIPLCLLWGTTTLINFKAIGAGDVKLFGVVRPLYSSGRYLSTSTNNNSTLLTYRYIQNSFWTFLRNV